MNPLENQQKVIQELKRKIDLITEEILLLDDEISVEEIRLKKVAKEASDLSKQNTKLHLEKERKELEDLKTKVEQHLELTEEMEANDLLDEKLAEKLLLKAEAIQDQEIMSLKAEIAKKTKELEQMKKK
jgi:hypothetical protein